MRWTVEVSSLGKTDTQRFCVDAESWQRALQAARSQRGDDGPMSGFSIELLEEGYRAVDPLARVRFLVKKAPDDMALTTVLERPSAAPKGLAPSAPAPSVSIAAAPPAPFAPAAPAPVADAAPSTSSTDQTLPKLPPTPTSSANNGAPVGPGSSKGPAAPIAATDGKKLQTMVFGSSGDANVAEQSADRAAPTAIGSAIPGLPAVKLLTSREQNPNDASPLTYREYAFAVPEGTTEESAADVLRAQLRYVEAHIAAAKMGKLVNLACFDVEFTGKPTRPPLATLTWKDWKGDAVVAFPRRGGAPSKPPRPPSRMPPSLDAGALAQPSPPVIVPPAAPVPVVEPPVVTTASAPTFPPPRPGQGAPTQGHTLPHIQAAHASPAFSESADAQGQAAQQARAAQQAQAEAAQRAAAQQAAQHAAAQAEVAAQQAAAQQAAAQQAAAQQAAAQQAAAQQAAAQQAAAQQAAAQEAAAQRAAAQPAFPPPAPAPVAVANPGAPAPTSQAYVPVAPPAPIIAEADRAKDPGPGPGNGMVKTPSGRYVRGRVSGDELITSLFESMHDLHFLRDALDGGQFCLALATEVLPARAAIIHFFDIEKREWVVACTRGKETHQLLTMRHPEGDEILREAARKRRAVVVANAENANADRYRHIGGGRSLIVAPIMQAGRALGALEIINPLDGMPFTEDEGNAMTYIAEQFAEYLGSRGIVLDRDRIQSAAAR